MKGTDMKGKKPSVWIRLKQEAQLTDEDLWKARRAELHPTYLFRLYNKGKSVKSAINKAFRQRFKSVISIVEHYQLSKKYCNRLIRLKIKKSLIFKHCEDRDSAKAFIDVRFNKWLKEQGYSPLRNI